MNKMFLVRYNGAPLRVLRARSIRAALNTAVRLFGNEGIEVSDYSYEANV